MIVTRVEIWIGGKILSMNNDTELSFFNKRGVSVFKAEDCQFSEAAKARILRRT